ncbi:MAG: dehydrogenase, partial [Alphaproteobacteria bacterium]
MATFRVALSGDFIRPDGTPAFPMFDLAPLTSTKGVVLDHVAPVDGIMPADRLAGFDALILLGARFARASVPPNGGLA